MKNQKGFTLIESIIYLALFSIIIGGSLVAVYQIIKSTDASVNHIILQNEANFIFRKINWALSTANQVNSINTYSLDIIKDNEEVLTLWQSQGNIYIKRGAEDSLILNSSSVAVNLLSFTIIQDENQNNLLKVNFILTTAQNGKQASQSFSTNFYIN